MNLYLVSVDNVNYDEYDAFVVRAENEESARKLIANMKFNEEIFYMDERNRDKWLNNSKVEEISSDGEPDIILGSFNAG